jgi:tripartite ATP-independent transporter DctM subunit
MLGILSGYPLALPVGAIAIAAAYFLIGSESLNLAYQRLFILLRSYTLLAVPLFVFMGLTLERSGITDKMYEALYLWLGRMRGGLAIITIIIGTVVAACVGIIGASVTMLALLALSPMIKRGYSKSLASGTVCAGGCLGILIPPSVMLVMYGPMAEVSVGKLFMAAIVPGLILSVLYCFYIALRCWLQSEIAPPLPSEENKVPFIKKTTMLMTSMLPAVFIILSVLGAIFFGIAPPTEAAALGATGALILTVVYRKLTWQVLKEISLGTVKTTSMIMLIGGCSYMFVGIFMHIGGGKVVQRLILSVPYGAWGAFAVIMFLIFILGFLIDWMGIVFIMVPIMAPLIPKLGFDPLWFGMMVCINLQMSFMTPPVAAAIFYLKGVMDPALGITINDIIRGIVPFVIIIMIVLGLCIVFPDLILWLPGIMIK